MKKHSHIKYLLKIFLITGLVSGGILGIVYYAFLNLDFIGKKDPKIAEENRQRWENMLLFAEYRNGTDYCVIEVLDSSNIDISVGDKSGGTILNKKYKLSNDSVIVMGGIGHAGKYLNSDKFLIRGNKLMFKLDSQGEFDTVTTLAIRFNKIKQ